MKKLFGLTLALSLCLALVWGYFWALNTYIPQLLYSETAVIKETPSTTVAVQRAAHSPHRKVIKINTAGSFEPADVGGIDGIANEILRHAEKLEKSITIDIKDFSDTEIADKLLESGKYYYVSWTSIGSVVTFVPSYKIEEEIFYSLKTGDESTLSSKAELTLRTVRGIINEKITDGMSDYDKALVIHDYLVQSAEYDPVAAKNVTSENKDFPDNGDSFSAYGVLIKKKGVCQAYSEAFNIFMRLLGVECEELTGEADGVPHSWNRIKLNGEYYHIDVTYDDPSPDKKGETSHAYFCLTDEMISADHKWLKDNIECNSLSYNYFVRNNLIVKNQSDFDRVVGEAFKNGEQFAEMRLDGFELDNVSLEATARLTGRRSFMMSEAGGMGVVKVYLK